ncbi:uncharacterized protein LOC110441658 [Mizuhopecten yessoensis]|uniref:D-serine dehydratase n=1 Tax=Mizuhopecten yessoensis TaxID=6573 RepID=A0A210PIZ7_MIZYE|nr:uncharacterized protein LOC110441658 [Mizuhopecten yessoensis]XP_021340536.1 uncharacterized protein LOC110441658 [Mizuhopecten yessoensis]OWF36468.1 D-threo-3-hydroxyaspartate dehydratase [Mizuhopecten yessoensis]
MSDKFPETIYDVKTPSFLVDIDVIQRNVTRMKETCDRLGVQLRPHMKTHKTVELGEMMTDGTKKCLVVSTLDEAEFYASHGFDDILYAYPITQHKLGRCRRLGEKLDKFHMMFESPEGLESLKTSPRGNDRKWSVYLEIDLGLGRTGVEWDSEMALTLATEAANSPGIEFLGLYVHSGDSYLARGPDQMRESGKRNTDKLLQLKVRLAEAGVTCRSLCMGSTPGCSHPDDSMAQLDAFSPGNYAFYDAMQLRIGSCEEKDIACRVICRVISHKRSQNKMSVDAGFLGLSQDGMDQGLAGGPVVFQGHPELKLLGMCQELGSVGTQGTPLDFSKYPIGSLLFIYPHHSCATAALYENYYVHSGEKIVGVWKPTRGW